MGKDESIVSVERAIMIINKLTELKAPIGVSELAELVGLPKVTTYRFLATMQKNALISKNEDNEYSLGLAFIKYGEKVKSDIDIIKLARPVLNNLVETVGETVNLGILNENNVLTIYNKTGESSILISKLNPISPLYCSSMGKIFLSKMNNEIAKTYFKDQLEKRTVHTKTTYEEYLEYRNSFEELGICFDSEEYEYGLYCIAAPLLNCQNEVIAAVSISGPLSRVKLKNEESIIRSLRESTAKITQLIQEARL